jgi:hypothetical protein
MAIQMAKDKKKERAERTQSEAMAALVNGEEEDEDASTIPRATQATADAVGWCRSSPG